jgi:hypothetical protein
MAPRGEGGVQANRASRSAYAIGVLKNDHSFTQELPNEEFPSAVELISPRKNNIHL